MPNAHSVSRRSFFVALAVLLGAVYLAYANHFENAFHFDDFHSITDNIYIRDLHNLPRFFTDASTSSALPANRTWRPLVTASLAFDYWLGGGAQPFYFHLSTFLWFLLQLVVMWLLFSRLLDRVEPRPSNTWIAWFAAAWYGLHPAIAETVNYVIQRADALSTLGVVAGMAIYAGRPAWRRYGVYLVPVALAAMVKPPALVFPLLLAAYLFLFEEDLTRPGLRRSLFRALPALALSVAFAAIQYFLTPRTFAPTGTPAADYILTQPYVAFRYFVSFFLPAHLSADTDLAPLKSVFTLEAFGGLVFLAVLGAAIYWTARERNTRPIAFGLVWFVVALAPTALFPLAEVENDHRMFFPFVGLALAVTWTGALALFRRPLSESARSVAAAALACLLLLCALGTHRRNEVWRTEETLWRDVTWKSPRNGRGLMNYGLTLMARGDYAGAVSNFESALAYTPNYSLLHINLGIAYGALGRDAEAESRFRHALELAPGDAGALYYFGRWLHSKGREREASGALRVSIGRNPAVLPPRILLLQIYELTGQWPEFRALLDDSLRLAPADSGLLAFVGAEQRAPRTPAPDVTLRPEDYLDLSLRYHQTGRYQQSIEAAQMALRLRPDYAEAYNNIAAAYESMKDWDRAIAAAREAVRIKPDFALARNNLAYSLEQKRLAAARPK
jgi:tetratricopeptide (TPR) repeat protein